MISPYLTIVVPTYKRSAHLANLLHALREEIVNVENDVVVYVSDNCSPDDTSEIIDSVKENWPSLRRYRHETNVGSDRNFLHCLNEIETRWFWIIGDDDLPRRGVIAKVISLLRNRQPALLYLHSEWVAPALNRDRGEPVNELHFSELDALCFADRVHVWTTFISGMVVDRDRLKTSLGINSVDRFNDSSLVQLGWVLPLLNSSGPFIYVSDRCVLASQGNSGGYQLLTVFGVNFTRIVNQVFGVGHPIAQKLINGNISKFLPSLIWGTRDLRLGFRYANEDPWHALGTQLGSSYLYWVLLVPLGRFPRWLVLPLFLSWRALSRIATIGTFISLPVKKSMMRGKSCLAKVFAGKRVQ
jgi:abequosyltransferase